MNTRVTFSFLSATLLAVVATGFFLKPDPAIAEQAAEETDEIVVQAPAAVKRVVRVGRERGTVLELKLSISYADLDLRLHNDVVELEARINAAAREICKDLADITPRLEKPEPSCIRNAIASAREEMQEAIAAVS